MYEFEGFEGCRGSGALKIVRWRNCTIFEEVERDVTRRLESVEGEELAEKRWEGPVGAGIFRFSVLSRLQTLLAAAYRRVKA